ncbi:kinase-like domain-containing protein, partial [Halteromyces radiatus]|uniref:kinase-like domain-containing protein n=1 Tax=Halteromyces radiatus TaxID=101107 RepID=UPI00221F9CAA
NERYKRRQTKMLLVSLIESFCRIYGDSPDANRKVFFLICQTLKSLGIIDTEFIDEMASVRTTFQRTFHKLFYAALHTVQTEPFLDQPHRRKALFDLSIHHSRYHDDFVELGLLGRGGFAMAYRVKNKLDGIDYAVKKVQLGRDLQQGKTPYKKIFREIKHLARLEHPNVIRYYASWLEYDAGQVQNDEDDEDENDDVTYETPQRKQTKELLYQQGSISQPVSPSTSTDKKKITVHGGWTLFIQMQLCQTTLHDYIEIRNRDYGVVDPERNIALFTQILHGTAYIHEQGLIHRDLKPSNIFLTLSASTYPSTSDSCISSRILWDECIPKIGDFGLAAALVDEDSTIHDTTSPPSSSPTTIVPPILTKLKTEESSSSSSSTSSSMMNLKEVVQSRRHRRPVPAPLRRAHTIGIGTRTYASPEQLCYSGRPYDEKVDIYSLGIIFFELYQPFTTWMERADAISNLKNAMLPDGFVEKYPKESALILWMMDHNPERRPSVKQLLNYELFTQTPTVNMKRMELERQDMQRKLDELQQKLDSVSL